MFPREHAVDTPLRMKGIVTSLAVFQRIVFGRLRGIRGVVFATTTMHADIRVRGTRLDFWMRLAQSEERTKDQARSAETEIALYTPEYLVKIDMYDVRYGSMEQVNQKLAESGPGGYTDEVMAEFVAFQEYIIARRAKSATQEAAIQQGLAI